jgi:predicted Rossmann-fold nucleotide-binding protein
MGDVHIVFKGGTGTISEFGMSWASSRIHYGHNSPLILFGRFWQEIVGSFKKYMYMRPEEFKIYYIVDSPQAVLERIREREANGSD